MPSQCIWAALEMQYCKAQTSARNSRWLEPVLLCNLESLQALGHREAPNPLTPVFHHEFVLGRALKALTQEMPSKPNCKARLALRCREIG